MVCATWETEQERNVRDAMCVCASYLREHVSERQREREKRMRSYNNVDSWLVRDKTIRGDVYKAWNRHPSGSMSCVIS